MQNFVCKLDKELPIPLYLQIYQQIKQDIDHGRLKLATKLPSKRKLADFLAVSQTTIETAYAQLQAEGYIESRSRSGFFVSFDSSIYFAPPTMSPTPPTDNPKNHYRYDFTPHRIDTTLFPFASWKKQFKLLFASTDNNLLDLGDPQGDKVLREQIRQYLYHSRGVNCEIDQIIIGAGVEVCLSKLLILLEQLDPKQDIVCGMEYYGYSSVEQLFLERKKKVIKFPLIADEQKNGQYKTDFASLNQLPVNLLYLTPSHQYPYSNVLPIAERHQLLNWSSQENFRFIIEDDYDSEFRYKGRPIPALQYLDQQGKVIYLGSFSKLLMPSLRLAFMVLPPILLAQYRQLNYHSHCTVPRINQQLLAKFIQSGDFEKHLYRMRTTYRKKMELLCKLLHPYRDKIHYYGEQVGFYLLIELSKEQRSLLELQQLALAGGIKTYPIKHPKQTLFVLGFGHFSPQELEAAITLLIKQWGYDKNNIS
ncbi:GntR family transcriptional regulator [Mergibacter septicus]|uniref:MocR-like pyridoxine biosynthesis transcription factor PdxR n=1 Tax=Mergibacter septicus TaxID=221402 RepID=UPI001C74EBBC|nr:PLP-dependent aminotransferase family protein [Mergibacter septicus]QDJ12708.1 GntR family transcriptional regulator [Mergibacter septicus]